MIIDVPECEIGLIELMILLIFIDFGGNQLLKVKSLFFWGQEKKLKVSKTIWPGPDSPTWAMPKTTRCFFGEDFPYGNADIMTSFHFPFPPLLC